MHNERSCARLYHCSLTSFVNNSASAHRVVLAGSQMNYCAAVKLLREINHLVIILFAKLGVIFEFKRLSAPTGLTDLQNRHGAPCLSPYGS